MRNTSSFLPENFLGKMKKAFEKKNRPLSVKELGDKYRELFHPKCKDSDAWRKKG